MLTMHTTLGHRGPATRPTPVELVAAALSQGLTVAARGFVAAPDARHTPARFECLCMNGEAEGSGPIAMYEQATELDHAMSTFLRWPCLDPVFAADYSAFAAARAFVRAVGEPVAAGAARAALEASEAVFPIASDELGRSDADPLPAVVSGETGALAATGGC